MNNHPNHVSIGIICKPRDSGITLLTFPHHCSHQLQPVDCSVYGQLRRYYNRKCDAWQLHNNGKAHVHIWHCRNSGTIKAPRVHASEDCIWLQSCRCLSFWQGYFQGWEFHGIVCNRRKLPTKIQDLDEAAGTCSAGSDYFLGPADSATFAASASAVCRASGLVTGHRACNNPTSALATAPLNTDGPARSPIPASALSTVPFDTDCPARSPYSPLRSVHSSSWHRSCRWSSQISRHSHSCVQPYTPVVLQLIARLEPLCATRNWYKAITDSRTSKESIWCTRKACETLILNQHAAQSKTGYWNRKLRKNKGHERQDW